MSNLEASLPIANMEAALPFFSAARTFPLKTCIHSNDHVFTYADLLLQSRNISEQLSVISKGDLNGAAVCNLVAPSFEYSAVQWGIWRAGGMAVPLCLIHPQPELEYVIDNSETRLIVVTSELLHKIEPIVKERDIKVFVVDEFTPMANPSSFVDDGYYPIDMERHALMMYTSGTTGKPKGVIHTHRSIEAMAQMLTKAWQWTRDDEILHTLPLHHIHGIINALHCCLYMGATCHFLTQERFDAAKVWEMWVTQPINVYMAVPTIYCKLIAAFENASSETQERWTASCKKFRLQISGSAAMPVPVMKKWQEITGVVLLERYGMTEIGMGLSNLLTKERKPGKVGWPLPGVCARILESDEMEIQSPAMFKEYWKRPEATAEAFTTDGWFKTGDHAGIDPEDGYYFIKGRASVDILKVSGYKVSALEVEREMLAMPQVREVAVVGIPHSIYGDTVGAVVVLKHGQHLVLDELRDYLLQRLAPYKVPRRLVISGEIPRNVMGKAQKKRALVLFENE